MDFCRLSVATQVYIIHKVAPRYWRWWCGVVGNAFLLKRSYSTPGPVSTAMGDCLRAGTAIGFHASREHQLKFLVYQVVALSSVSPPASARQRLAQEIQLRNLSIHPSSNPRLPTRQRCNTETKNNEVDEVISTRCFIKGHPFSFFRNSVKSRSIYTKFLSDVAEKLLIRNI